ncbi:MAG: glutaminyl-peptide cyclotransferase [Chloroflexi bacterium]|nr:glutaminyl-peptide cyclotransferase [Chloroflexota bacterium]
MRHCPHSRTAPHGRTHGRSHPCALTNRHCPSTGYSNQRCRYGRFVRPGPYLYLSNHQRLPHDPNAFTQGLVFHRGVLYEGTGRNGYSSIRLTNLETGSVLQQRDLGAEYFGEGITIWQDRLIQLTWQSGVGFIYDLTTFAPLGSFSYPGEGWGLTHDDQRLIMSDGTDVIRFLDLESLAENGRIQVHDQNGPVMQLNELEYINGEIWANIWQTNTIARISPQTGQVVGWIDLTGLLNPADLTQPADVLNGIAYDANHDRLFVTGKWWPKLFEIKLILEPSS